MALNTTPLTGGSFIRNKDGSLKQVAGTEPAAAPAAIAPAAEAAAPAQTSEPSTPPAGTLKKGK
ncbi:hypothetical protein [Mesorhizobium sp.]|uniref:hypothetical protein n=1 Tax=Mesorhizobium sp. TaxID=1871066 RepID=UPI000FEA416E|nr:hypothetical protein [Mesorhizobium sp.]RWC58921.1 MAG: hypothetical protein EOS56_18605 [Mesorhizobium sp.]RWC66533.1 MAG: hypothetical protein EOS29_03960 [Mesorhizobium sp.]